MSCNVKADEGLAAAGIREWAVKHVGGSRWRRDCVRVADCAKLKQTRQGVPFARYEQHSKTDRPICYPRPDLEQERESRSCAWLNSNR